MRQEQTKDMYATLTSTLNFYYSDTKNVCVCI